MGVQKAQPTKTLAARIPVTDHEAMVNLSLETGRPMAYYIKEAVKMFLDSDAISAYKSQKIMEDMKLGKVKTYTYEEIRAEYDI